MCHCSFLCSNLIAIVEKNLIAIVKKIWLRLCWIAIQFVVVALFVFNAKIYEVNFIKFWIVMFCLIYCHRCLPSCVIQAHVWLLNGRMRFGGHCGLSPAVVTWYCGVQFVLRRFICVCFSGIEWCTEPPLELGYVHHSSRNLIKCFALFHLGKPTLVPSWETGVPVDREDNCPSRQVYNN